jgi:hypothetical protein
MVVSLILLKCLGIYLLFYLPQLRLRNYQYDPHIGILTASRVSGLPLGRIFFQRSYGMALPVLSLSLQYDRFRGDLPRYKSFHALLVSISGPLFYLFTWQLTGSEAVACTAALFYALSYHFPIVGNWLIQPEHYEILFFLAGASLALAGSARHSLALTAAGSLVMGCSLLCKLPGLPSLWVMTLLLARAPAGGGWTAALLGFAYLAPLFAFYAAAKTVAKTEIPAPGSRKEGEGGFLKLLESTVSRYLTYYRSNPGGYVDVFVKYHLSRYTLQFLPLLFLATVFYLKGEYYRKDDLLVGIAVVSLIFVLRMGFAYWYSFNIVVCIAAALALFSLPAQLFPWVAATAGALALVSTFRMARDPALGLYRAKGLQHTPCDVLAGHLKETLAPGQTWFSNINRAYSFLYPLSERGFPGYFSILLMGAYEPLIDHNRVQPIVASEGMALARTIAETPPEVIVQSDLDWPIVNLSALERYCGVSYRPVAAGNQFVIYRLSERSPLPFEPSAVDIPTLFDARLGLQQTREVTALFAAQKKEAECAPQAGPGPAAPAPVPEREKPARRVAKRVALFLNSCPPELARRGQGALHPAASPSYSVQLDLLQETFCGDSDFYSHNLQKAGWYAADLFADCRELQLAWAQENDFPSSDLNAILLEQVRRVRPELVYLQDVSMATPKLLCELRKHCRLLVAQHASTAAPQPDFSQFDLVFSSQPSQIEAIKAHDTTGYYQPLAFDPRCVGNTVPYRHRYIEASFIGDLLPLGHSGYELLEFLAGATPLLYWGAEVESFPAGSAVATRYQGEAYGREMFQLIKNSKITVYHHPAAADRHACNRRLFEATGAGALLITDYQDNLGELFEIGTEVVAYRSPQECAEQIGYYLAHPDEAEAIAGAGRRRTLRDHTYAVRMAQTAAILDRHFSDRYQQLPS